MDSVKVSDKYEIVNRLSDGGRLECLRYGETWRDLTGDNLVLSMFYKIQELEEQNEKLKKDSATELFKMIDES